MGRLLYQPPLLQRPQDARARVPGVGVDAASLELPGRRKALGRRVLDRPVHRLFRRGREPTAGGDRVCGRACDLSLSVSDDRGLAAAPSVAPPGTSEPPGDTPEETVGPSVYACPRVAPEGRRSPRLALWGSCGPSCAFIRGIKNLQRPDEARAPSPRSRERTLPPSASWTPAEIVLMTKQACRQPQDRWLKIRNPRTLGMKISTNARSRQLRQSLRGSPLPEKTVAGPDNPRPSLPPSTSRHELQCRSSRRRLPCGKPSQHREAPA